MKMANCRRALGSHKSGGLLGETTTTQPVLEGAIGRVLHDEMIAIGVLKGIEERDDERVLANLLKDGMFFDHTVRAICHDLPFADSLEDRLDSL